MLDSKLIPRALFTFENGGGSHFENRRGECPGYEVVLDSSCKYTLVISVKPIPISHTYHLMPKLQTLRLIQRSSKTISFGPRHRSLDGVVIVPFAVRSVCVWDRLCVFGNFEWQD